MTRTKCRMCRQWMHSKTTTATPRLRAPAPDADVCVECQEARRLRREDRERVLRAMAGVGMWERRDQ